MAPGRKPCTKMSASRVSPASVSRPSGFAQIDEGRELAAAVVDHQRAHLRQMRGRHQQHVGAMRRERASAHRAGDHAGEIEHAHAGERPVARAAAAAAAHRRCARSRTPEAPATARPCGCASHSANERVIVTTSPASAAAVSNASPCQPSSARCTASRVIVAAEQLQHAVAVMREVGVQPHPAPVAAAVEPGDLVPRLAAAVRRRRADSARCETRLRHRAWRRRRAGAARRAAATARPPQARPPRCSPARRCRPRTRRAAPARRRSVRPIRARRRACAARRQSAGERVFRILEGVP